MNCRIGIVAVLAAIIVLVACCALVACQSHTPGGDPAPDPEEVGYTVSAVCAQDGSSPGYLAKITVTLDHIPSKAPGNATPTAVLYTSAIGGPLLTLDALTLTSWSSLPSGVAWSEGDPVDCSAWSLKSDYAYLTLTKTQTLSD